MAFRRGKKKEIVGSSIHIEAEKSERISNRLEHVMVKEDSSKPKPLTHRIKSRAARISQHKRFKPAVAALVAVVLLASLALIFARDDEPQVAVKEGPKCSYAVLEKSKPLLDPKKISELHAVVDEIEAIPGYDQDANCLYVTLTYYINTSDAVKSREVYDKLANVYDPQEGYETIIVDTAQKPEELKPTVEFLEEQAKQYSPEKLSPAGAPL